MGLREAGTGNVRVGPAAGQARGFRTPRPHPAPGAPAHLRSRAEAARCGRAAAGSPGARAGTGPGGSARGRPCGGVPPHRLPAGPGGPGSLRLDFQRLSPRPRRPPRGTAGPRVPPRPGRAEPSLPPRPAATALPGAAAPPPGTGEQRAEARQAPAGSRAGAALSARRRGTAARGRPRGRRPPCAPRGRSGHGSEHGSMGLGPPQSGPGPRGRRRPERGSPDFPPRSPPCSGKRHIDPGRRSPRPSPWRSPSCTGSPLAG